MRKKIVAGNWKMNKTHAEAFELINAIVQEQQSLKNHVIKIIAPPFVYLQQACDKVINVPEFYVAAQNCHAEDSGAYTGEVSASMLNSIGVGYVIIGHSERRTYFNETNDFLYKKVVSVLSKNMKPIFCIGELLKERNAGEHFNVVKKQLEEVVFKLSAQDFSNIVIAYEPVWAIGTGVTATIAQAQEMHQFIREQIKIKMGVDAAQACSILYGGSCNAQNAKELFACSDVDGGLIGGASLKAADFISIINSFS